MLWRKMLAIVLLYFASPIAATCSCTYNNGRNDLPPYLDTSGDLNPEQESLPSTTTRSYTAQLSPYAGCPATVEKPYTLRVFPNLSNQITHSSSWQFTYAPTAPLGSPKSDNFDQYHEIVVFTHEDANGKVYASSELLFMIENYDFFMLTSTDKASEVARLKNNFCRKLMVPPAASLPWTQPQDFKFLYPSSAQRSFLLTSLLDNRRERGCVAALSMCSDAMLSYTAKWMNGPTQPFIGVSLPTSTASNSPPFSFLLESQADLKLKASESVPLPTTFQVPNTSGVYDLSFEVCGSNPADATAQACSTLPLKYIDCRVGFSFAATPIILTATSQGPGTSGSTNFFDLSFNANNRSTRRPFDVFSAVTAHSDCGTYSLTMTSTGTGLSLSQTSTSQWRLEYDPSTYTPLTSYGQTMTVTLTLSYNSLPFSIQYQFELRVWNCIPQTTPPTMIVLAHSSTSQSKTYTDFAGIGLNQFCLAASAETFDLSANSNLASLASSTGNQLTIASNPAVLAAVAGTYTILHTHGEAKETFQMIVCAIVEPAVPRQSGQDLYQVHFRSTAVYALDFNWYSNSNALCPGIWYNWFVSSDSDYDPFSSTSTAFKTPTSDNYSQYFGWSLWMNAAKPSPVVVKIFFQVLFIGTTDPGISRLNTIKVYDCARTRITPPAPIDPALVEVELGTNFSITTGWGSFAFTGAETICQVTRHKVVATFADGGNIVWHVESAFSWPIASQTIVTFNTNARWASTLLTTNLGLNLAEFRFADLTDKTVLYGLNRLMISGGFYDAATAQNRFDETNSLTFTVKIINPCERSKVLTIGDATQLLYISGQPSHFVSTQLLVDESLFEQNPLVLAVDKTKFTANEALCGLITLGWTAKHADSTDVFHAGVSQLAQATPPTISILYSSWPAGVLERQYTLTLLAWHQNFPAYVASLSIEVTDVRCSIRFSGMQGNVVPPSTNASTPATLGPVALNTLASSQTFTFPLNADTPLKCQDLAYASIWLSGPATSNAMTEMPPTWTQRLAFNQFKITPLTPLQNQAGVYTGQVKRSQLYRVLKDLDFEMVLCWITQPTVKFDYSDPTVMQEPFTIDVVGSKSVLKVDLTAYSVNDIGKCGPLVYSASTSSLANPNFDAFSLGLATITDNRLVFNSINVSGKYPLGTLTVTVSVRQSSTPAIAYQTTFTIAVVNCLQEPFTVTGADTLQGTEHEFRFPTFLKTVAFPEVLTFDNSDAKLACSVFEYRITCYDHQIDLNALSPTSHSVKTSSNNVYQGGRTDSALSAPCSKFQYDTALTARSILFSSGLYAVTDLTPYEGSYRFRGQPIHSSGQPYSTSVEFTALVKLNCDDVEIKRPTAPLLFSISAPATEPSSLPRVPFDSDALFFWMRASRDFPLPGAHINPHPFSCTLKQSLGETLDGGLTFDNSRAASLGVSLDLSGSVPIIRVEHAGNTYLTQNWANMMYEARLQYTPVGGTSLVDSTSRATLQFKLFLFPDCTPRADLEELVAAKEVVNGEFQIDGTDTSLLSLQLTHPKLIAELNELVCAVTPVLVHTAQPSSATSQSGVVWIEPANPHVILKVKAKANTQVFEYDHSSNDALICSLSNVGQRDCSIRYKQEARSLNGTVDVQSTGTIVVHSECLYIKTKHANQAPYWQLSSLDPLSLHSNLKAGYEVRDPEMSFELPFVVPQLNSLPGKEIFSRCGPLVYTITIASSFSGPYEPAITVQKTADTDFTSADVRVFTTNQTYALHAGVDYRTEFRFTISAVFSWYPAEIVFVRDPVSFYIRDYCAGMKFSQPPELTLLTQEKWGKFNMTRGVLSAKTNTIDPWVFSLSKFLMTNSTVFSMSYMSYSKWRPDNTWPEVVNQGCGNLSYNLTSLSWSETWKGNDIMSRPIGAAYFGTTGTIHIIDASKRVQLGDHNATLEVASDLVPISSKQLIRFEIQILDCYVDSFSAGVQSFNNTVMEINQKVIFDFVDYVQFPACGFPINYTVTLVEKPYGSRVNPPFAADKEGRQPEPPFVSLGVTQVLIQPTSAHQSKGYTVYIRGHLKVNSTLQGPVTALNDAFDVQVPSQLVNLANTAPLVSNKVSMLSATADESLIYSVGIPYDMQLDNFYLSEWGVEGGETPTWVQFVNETVSAGIKFKISPSLANEGEQYEVFYTLQDTNSRQPKGQKFKFSLSVVVLNSKFSEREQQIVAVKQEQKPEIIKVFVDAPDGEGLMDIRFSKGIKLPSNATEWSNLNEGSSRLNVSLLVSQQTETLLYDQDLRLEMSWTVAEVHTKDKDGNVQVVRPWKADAHNATRRLGEDSKANETLIEVDKLKLRLNFTQPTTVSRTAFDKVRVEVLQHMFNEETLSYPPEIALFVEMNKQDYTRQLNIPQQYDQGMIKAAAAMTEKAENGLKAFMSANIVISLFSAGALQYLWGLINALQMIVLTVLFKVEIPPNADMIMTMILKLCQLEIIDSTFIIGHMFDFRQTEAFETSYNEEGEPYSKFGDVGYDSAIYIELLGFIFVIVLAYCALAILRKLLQLACKCCGDNCCTRRVRRRQQIEVVIIRFLLESCLEIGMSAMLSLLMVSQDELSSPPLFSLKTDSETFAHPWEVFSFVLAILSLLGLVLAPIFFIRMSIRYRSDVAKPEDEREMTTELGALFKGYRVNKFALFYPVVFFLRRYFMILVCTLMPGLKYAQIFSQIFVTMFVIYYIIFFKPMSDPFLNKQETFNELSVLVAAYPLFIFTNWVDDIETRVRVGWFLVAIISLNVLINMTILVVQMLLQAYRSLKYCCIRRRKINERKERLRRLQLQILLKQQKEQEQGRQNLEGERDNITSQAIQARTKVAKIQNSRSLPVVNDSRARIQQGSVCSVELQNQEDVLVSIEDERYLRRLGYDRNGFALADQDFVVDDPNDYLPPRQQLIEEMKHTQLQRQGLTGQLLGPNKPPQIATTAQLARINYDSIIPPWAQLSQLQLEEEQQKKAKQQPTKNERNKAKKRATKR